MPTARGRDEAALFHLLNLARERSSSVVVTASRPVEAWGLSVADLRSRLRLAPGVHLAPPDEALLKVVLVKLFLDRQLVVDTSVVDALALRLDRSLARARDVVALLDREGLSRRRRITRPLALATLAALEGERGRRIRKRILATSPIKTEPTAPGRARGATCKHERLSPAPFTQMSNCPVTG